MRVAARAPNHLGDGVVALPAMHALARLGELTIHGPGWAPIVYRDVDARFLPPGRMRGADLAVLFAPSLRAALEAAAVPRRIGTATDRRGWLLTDRVSPGRHTADTYAALAAAAGARAEGLPRWTPRPGDPEVDVPDGHVGLNPITAGGPMRQWPGFAALAARIERPVVVYGGPGEQAKVDAVCSGRTTAVGWSLPAFASALRRCALLVSNDSGAAHFARAVGAPTLVVYGPTDPTTTGPQGAAAMYSERPACAPCHRRRCPHDLECWRLPVERVLAAIEGRLGG